MTPLQPPDAPYHPTWYVGRPHEEQRAFDALERGRPVLLSGPRRQGRTWLAAHIAETWRSAAADRRLAAVRFHTFPAGAFASFDACLRAVAAALRASLGDAGLPSPETAWAARGDAASKLDTFLARDVLPRLRGPLLVLLDRLDIVGTTPFPEAFSSLLRAWADRAREGEPWSRLRLLATVSTPPAGPRSEVDPTCCLDVGDPIAIGDLDRAQVADLAGRHGFVFSAEDLDRLVDLAGGHPSLVRAVLFDLAEQRYTLDHLAAGDALGPSFASDHLLRHRTRLAASPELAGAFDQLAKDPRADVPTALVDTLLRQGLVRPGDGGGHPVRVRLHARLLQPDAPAPAVRRRARVFVSHAAADDAHRDRLEAHLRILEQSGIIEPWHRRRLLAGEAWDRALDRKIAQADIVLLLVSPAFLASDYCWDVEMKRALERHQAREATVVPVLVEPCAFRASHQLATLPALPDDEVPVTRWSDPDDAWVEVTLALRRLITDRL